MSRVLIAGCGDVGTVLGLELARDGHQVWGLRRRPDRLPAPITPVVADLADPASLGAVAVRPQVVVYAAAADERTDAAYERAYVTGVRNTLAAFLSRGTVERVVFTSSTAVYGQRDGQWVDERSPTEPTGFTGRRVLEGEDLVLRAGLPGIVVRLGGIYGPGRTRLIDQVRAGRATCPEGPPIYTNRIHRDDCAGVLRHLLAAPDATGVWLGVDHEPAERCEVLRWLAARLGVPPPALGPGEPTPSNKRCRNAKLVASGYVFRYPSYREGYAAVLAQLPGARAAD